MRETIHARILAGRRDFYVGRLLEVPGVCSQGYTLEDLRENIQDAYELMIPRIDDLCRGADFCT